MVSEFDQRMQYMKERSKSLNDLREVVNELYHLMDNWTVTKEQQDYSSRFGNTLERVQRVYARAKVE